MEKKRTINRKQKALLVLPLVVIPFLTLAFWALGGGQGEARTQSKAQGLNLQLPDARLKDGSSENKMSFYDEAEKDSAHVKKERGDVLSFSSRENDTTPLSNSTAGYDPSPQVGIDKRDANEEKVYQKLAELNQQLGRSATGKGQGSTAARTMTGKRNTPLNEEAIRQTASALQNGDGEFRSSEDTDMNNINGLMEKVLDIQHPERVSERLKEKSKQQRGAVFVVNPTHAAASVSLLDSGAKQRRAAASFYGLVNVHDSENPFSVSAIVHRAQSLVDGAVLKLRLCDDVLISGQIIPKGTFIYGLVSLNGERLRCAVTSVRCGNQLFPVNLQVYDMDGMPGLYIPGAITREVAKSSVDNAAQMLEVTSLDPSLKAQATSTGLSAVRSLLTKKAKRVKVSVRAGYTVLLKNGNE